MIISKTLLAALGTIALISAPSETPTWQSTKRDVKKIDRVVLHCTAALKSIEPNAELPKEKWFDKDSILDIWTKVKAGPHYYIDREGKQHDLVPEKFKAKHATLYNTRSIGIELAGLNDENWVQDTAKQKLTEEELPLYLAYTDAQYKQLNALLADIAKRHPEAKVICHSDILDEAKVTAESGLTVRKSPAGERDGALPYGTRVRLLSKQKVEKTTWYKIRTKEKDATKQTKGWVSGAHLKRLARKADPGSKFDRSKVKGMAFTKDDF